jgi:hypothetical protein
MTPLRLDCSPAEYLADPAPEPSLSSSIAKVLCEQSPAHARLAHPRLGGKPSENTAATDHGSLIHRLLLGKGAEIATVDAADWRTKAARDEREAAREAGKVPVLALQAGYAGFAASAIKVNLANVGFAFEGESEVPLLWQEQAFMSPLAQHADENPALYATAAAVTGMAPHWEPTPPIWARAMLDHVVPRDGRLLVYDVKTCESAHPDACLRSAVRYGYDIQAHAYTRAAELVWPDYAGRVTFTFLFCETEPPYAVLPATFDGIMRERGRRRWQYAVETWSRCLHTDTWPGYATEPVTLWSPDWLLRQEEMQR